MEFGCALKELSPFVSTPSKGPPKLGDEAFKGQEGLVGARGHQGASREEEKARVVRDWCLGMSSCDPCTSNGDH